MLCKFKIYYRDNKILSVKPHDSKQKKRIYSKSSLCYFRKIEICVFQGSNHFIFTWWCEFTQGSVFLNKLFYQKQKKTIYSKSLLCYFRKFDIFVHPESQ